MRQKNLNWLIGYSSVAHMGFVFLGIASLNFIGVTGAVLVMIAHGFLAALTFGLSGYLYQTHRHAGDGPARRVVAAAAVFGRGVDHGDVRRLRVAGIRQFCRRNHGVLRRVGKSRVALRHDAGGVGRAGDWRGVYAAGDPQRAARPAAGKMDGCWRRPPGRCARLPYLMLLACLLVFGFFPRLLADKIKPDAERIVNVAGPAVAKAPAARQTAPVKQAKRRKK